MNATAHDDARRLPRLFTAAFALGTFALGAPSALGQGTGSSMSARVHVLNASQRPAHPRASDLESATLRSRATSAALPVRPLPLPTATSLASRSAGEMLTHDLGAAKVVTGPIDSRSNGRNGGRVGPTDFTALQRVRDTDRTLYPWRANCKIFTVMPNNVIYESSGALIDPMHVLTSGGAVHDKNLGGWAKAIRVVPAYDGSKTGSERAPYSEAAATRMATWSGWANRRDIEHNVGVIVLDRPVGGLTGWFGRGWQTNCKVFTGAPFRYGCYPKESNTPYDGKRMWWSTGVFEHCPSLFSAKFNRRIFGGETGAGVAQMMNGVPVCLAVVSGMTQGVSIAARLTQAKSGHITSMFNSARPDTFDLTTLAVTGPARAPTRSQLTSLRLRVHNYSKAEFKGRLYNSVYLSTNPIISTFDTKLGDYYADFTLGSLRTTTLSWSSFSPVLPANTKPGTYYVGVILTTKDANAANQATSPRDVLKIEVWEGGLFKSFGSSCRGTKATPLHLATNPNGRPVFKTTSSYQLWNGRPNSAAVLFYGLDNQRWGPFRLPFDLGLLGAVGCKLYTNPLVSFTVPTFLLGQASVRIHHAPNITFIGAKAYTQYAVFDPGANALNVTSTNAIETTVGGLR